MAKKAHKLNYSPEYNFKVLGIISDEKDYKLIWNINNTLKWQLDRKEDYTFYDKKNQKNLQLPLFSYTSDCTYVSYKVLANKHENLSFPEELKNIDYLLIIYDESGTENISLLIDKLKKTDGVRGVFQIDPSGLKNREFLILH